MMFVGAILFTLYGLRFVASEYGFDCWSGAGAGKWIEVVGDWGSQKNVEFGIFGIVVRSHVNKGGYKDSPRHRRTGL